MKFPRHPAVTALATLVIIAFAGCTRATRSHATATPRASPDSPFLLVLGTAQDAGIPQAGAFEHPGWNDPSKRRLVVCLAIVDPRSNGAWMIEATPDFREQLYRLHDAISPRLLPAPFPSGIFLTHAHIGHYTGLMFLGHESMGANGIPVYAMPRMSEFLSTNAPWSQLVAYGNIELRPLEAGVPVALAPDIAVTPVLVPHRQEYAEVVGFRIDGPRTSVLFIPDIDAWEQWDAQGARLEDALATVDVAYLDGTFFANGEIPGRDMSGFPHPFISHTIERLSALPASERAKVRFIHLNHTNPAQFPGPQRESVRRIGMRIAGDGERIGL
jgi:pyrroloquinoline quinone biosynthesis protein B